MLDGLLSELETSLSRSAAGAAYVTTLFVGIHATRWTAAMLPMTPAEKAMDTQRWVCRTPLLQFIGASSEDEHEARRCSVPFLRVSAASYVILAIACRKKARGILQRTRNRRVSAQRNYTLPC